ncbi:TonB-dependent receptor [Aurantiacibacter poecillastricola]|uniref:TonB-dependent receptor n=1 Tax=Aurantiacibacter poecillastricola TaxID=3064385 RepID=UPI00273FA44C|nr:TonB-dependent receptor [Aurantiacibacter sp. 219JJ12-13]MDP5260882.1 TonB-dependent receptor [Aurantiacibacter sp. 219JJ12-13]
MNFRKSACFARGSASILAIAIGIGSATTAFAQQEEEGANPLDPEDTAIIVTGVRASLERGIDLKRNSSGVVDGISAEDIGRFPDTNLAESLQRITGVSIDRVNGEGSRVTVRGFGPGFNLVTLNGRTLPTASIASVGQDQNGDFVAGTTRSFDFANLASEGVSRLEVYKTARAAIPGGGIGAAINIVTRRPLDAPEGFSGSIGAKAVYDEADTYDLDRVTPEVSGIINWGNADGTFGVGLFGSFQRRNNSAVSESANDWNILPYSEFASSTTFRRADGSTVIQGAPSDPDTLIGIPNDTRYHYSEFSRERINGQLTVQFAPSDALEISADATYYRNQAEEQRTDQTTWYNRPFDAITFDGNPDVATAIFIDDVITAPKDGGFEQQYRATEDELYSLGLNIAYDLTEDFRLTLDGHHSEANARPNNPNGNTSTLFAFAQKSIVDQGLEIVDGFPRQFITFDDQNGNNNGVLDIPDLGTQVARSQTAYQSQTVDEVRLMADWFVGDDDRVSFGASYRGADMSSQTTSTYNALGDWGVGNIGDIAATAPDLVTPFCLVCQWQDFDTGIDPGDPLATAFRGDATQLFNAFVTTPVVDGTTDNRVQEDIFAAYAEVELNTELMGRPVNVLAGLRYEHTNSESTTLQGIPQQIVWTQNNDFVSNLSPDQQAVSGDNSYDHFLPAFDLSVDVTDDFIARVSFGRTIARPDFGSLFASTNPGNPNRPTALGGIPGGNRGNPQLVPLVSDNVDVSLEWYFAPSSYISAGFFDKRVQNFVGTGQSTQPLFGLRDPSSGAPGTVSGQAIEYLEANNLDVSDDNLFVLSALIDNFGFDEGVAQFTANLGPNGLSQTYIDNINIAYDLVGGPEDPLYEFQTQQPVNSEDAHIYGFELAGQYFFGDTGFGVAAAYTLVRGDVGYDITRPTSADQFALLGLSDTANASLIFEKYGLSTRLTYNWRDTFLSNNSRGSSRNPVFVDTYDQFDLNVSYDITDNVVVSFEAINLTGSNVKTYARTENQPWFIVEGRPRYYLGARLRF